MHRPSNDAVAGSRGAAIAFAAAAAVAAFAQTPSLAADTCSAHSAATVPPVVELYTSEGCNS
jgi:hypothetical protein